MAKTPGNQTSNLSETASQPLKHPPKTDTLSLADQTMPVLKVIASLKVTVVLFALSIFLVFAGTLAQTTMGVEQTVKEYFRCWSVNLKFQVLFPESFFPTWQKIPGRIFYPGGWMIGTALLINLATAHAIRFKIQAKGQRLLSGLGVLALGMLATWWVIVSGSNKDGFQIDNKDQWPILWQILKFGMGVLWVGMASSLLKIESDRKIERWTIISLTVTLGALLAYIFIAGKDAELNSSSMRILWQLLKGTFAGVVLLAGCVLVFKKRAGIVLLHGGVAMIMLNELYVGMVQLENQMPIVEGETINWVHDHSNPEFVVIDHSPEDHTDVTAVPFARLQRAEREEGMVQHDDLPFDFKVLKYYSNSVLTETPPPVKNNLATEGLGLETGVMEKEPGTGTDSSGKVDVASAYIQFFKKGSTADPLATLLLCQLYTREQTLLVDGKPYRLSLRSKRTYMPFSVHLVDARSDKYLGTEMTRNFQSDIWLVDSDRNARKFVEISMNNPLRYAGETFYQSGFNTIKVVENGRMVEKDVTTLQVVTNSGWMIPYVACMIVGTGMLAHFWLVLLRFLNRRAAGSIPSSPVETEPQIAAKPSRHQNNNLKSTANSDPDVTLYVAPESPDWKQTLIRYAPLLTVLFFAGWLGGKAVPPRYSEAEMNLYQFGELPVVYGGRIKPFDSLARNSLRQISHKQTFKDEEGIKRPAIQWFLDVIARPKTADRYRVFRIENLDLLQEMGLPRRSGFRYAYHEFEPRLGRLGEIVNEIHVNKIPEKKQTVFQRKSIGFRSKVRLYLELRSTYLIPLTDMKDGHDQIINLLININPQMEQVPLAVPVKVEKEVVEEEENPNWEWKPFTLQATPLWIRAYAKARGHKKYSTLTEDLIQSEHSKEILTRLQMLVTKNMAEQLKNRMPPMSRQERERRIAFRVRGLPFSQLLEEARIPLLSLLVTGMNGETLDSESSQGVTGLAEIFAAYRDGETESFNTEVDKYLAYLDEEAPDDYNAKKINWESWFNHFEPFYHSVVLYLFAFIFSALAWLGWSKPLNRTAFWLIVVSFSVQTLALIVRMYLSGRPMVTVTNLYSSAVFIGWACCLLGLIMECVFDIGIGNIVASVAGAGTLLVAHFLAIDGDTLSVMQAVLDTNFWLATHVTSITLGYATTFVAGLLGVVYIARGLFTPHLTHDEGKSLNRMIYGSVCFAIFFSFIGTVLGGLWADDSWGRFWGWDPKENGALIIVIWNALVLHARWGNMVKDRGMAVLAVGGNIVTCWSWFGVNLLGVGLHSYGFQSGVGFWLAVIVLVHLAVVGMGCTPKELWSSFRKQEEIKQKSATRT